MAAGTKDFDHFIPRFLVFGALQPSPQPVHEGSRPRPLRIGRGSRFAPTCVQRQESPGSRGSLWLLSVASFVGAVSLPGGATCRDNPEQAKTVPEAAPR